MPNGLRLGFDDVVGASTAMTTTIIAATTATATAAAARRMSTRGRPTCGTGRASAVSGHATIARLAKFEPWPRSAPRKIAPPRAR
jgi:hypothetical protein